MRIAGKTLSTTSGVVITLKRGEDDFPLFVSPRSPNLVETWEKRGLKSPKPKIIFARVEGKPVKDENGTPIKEEDVNDPSYVAASEEFWGRYAAVMLRNALRNCDDVEISTVQPTEGTPAEWLKYCDDLRAELYDNESGFTNTESGKILDVARSLDGRFSVDDSLTDFLSPLLGD